MSRSYRHKVTRIHSVVETVYVDAEDLQQAVDEAQVVGAGERRELSVSSWTAQALCPRCGEGLVKASDGWYDCNLWSCQYSEFQESWNEMKAEEEREARRADNR